MPFDRKEITALQSENYSLERQLFSYQRSLSISQSRNGSTQPGAPDDLTMAGTSTNGGDYSGQSQPTNSSAHRDFFTRGRQESSDTEYA